MTTGSGLEISSFVAYGFAAYDFKGKNFFFVIVLIILSIPFEVIMLPLYKQISTWGMMDSYVAVVLPFLAHASTIFFFRQYLLGLPKSLIEAGRIDGATEYGIFFKLIVPIMKPAFSAMAILNGMNAWNNYMWPLLVIRSSSKYTLTIGLNTLINPYGDLHYSDLYLVYLLPEILYRRYDSRSCKRIIHRQKDHPVNSRICRVSQDGLFFFR